MVSAEKLVKTLGANGTGAGRTRPGPPTLGQMSSCSIPSRKGIPLLLFSVSGVDGHERAPVPNSSELPLDGTVTFNRNIVYAADLHMLPDRLRSYLLNLYRSH